MLAGCSSDTGNANADEAQEAVVPLEERVTFEEVALPEELTSTSRSVGSWSAVAQAGDLPRLAVTRVFHGKANPANVGIWQATGTDLLSEQGEVEVEGDVLSASIASDGQVTAIAGMTVADGKALGYLLTSTDRTTWEQVDLPREVAAVVASEIAVAEGHIHLLGFGATGRVPQLAVYDTADGTSSVTDLPAPSDEDSVSMDGVAAIGQRVVVITETGPAGQDIEPVAHVSTDGGATFTSSAGMGGAGFDIKGIVAAGDEFVAVGSVRTAGFGKPASWSSADGQSWSVDDISSLWEWDPSDWSHLQHDVPFHAPIYDEQSDTVTATMRPGDYAPAAVLRDSDGVWEAWLYTDMGGWTNNAIVTPVGNGFSAVGTINAGSAVERVWPRILEPSMDGRAETQLLDYTAEPTRLSVDDLGDRAGMSALTMTYTARDDGGMRRTATPQWYSYTPDGGIVAEEWVPEGLSSDASPVLSADLDSGDVVAASSASGGEKYIGRSWLRQGGTWVDGATFDAEGYQQPTSVHRTSSGWLISSVVGDDGLISTDRTAQVEASTDGLAWSTQEVEHPFDDGRESHIRAICESPAGAIAAGYAEDSDGHQWAVAWRQSGEVWEASVIADSGGTWAGSCVATDEGVTVFGADGRLTGSWHSTDGQTFEQLEALDEGHRISGVTEVPGGFAASGSLVTEDYFGPVLWLSPDAETWQWLPLPSTTGSLGHSTVAVAGDDLLVLHDDSLGVWRVPDIASVLAE